MNTELDTLTGAVQEHWVLDPEEITMDGTEAGRGEQGIVYHAKWRGLKSVAKILPQVSASDQTGFPDP